MPNGYPRDGISTPHLTTIKGSDILELGPKIHTQKNVTCC